ncbi:hypothetical protein [Herminiimonas contaminans]|uniref:Uncharacterized protein n=1 Tax=Herminiimonas contaminans TaxID=1111140 RepID=A0ABS0EUD5_9BURK|nr:hypothetical protein [Herminiimonas contaminans]MBF8177674.1 hypothetical protein [Herminiimonas contaminans]
MSESSREMPKYQCHKQVYALKIEKIEQSPADFECEGGSYHITPADAGYGAFPVPAAFVDKHKPEAGGYYVVYDDGYKSYSPASAFESGYAPI